MAKLNIEAIKLLYKSTSPSVDLRPTIAYTMYASGVSYRQIGEVFNISPQAVNEIVDRMERKLTDGLDS